MKRLLFLFFTLFALLAGITFWWYSAVKPVSSDPFLKDFLIVKGSSASQIGNKLEREGFIKSDLAFKIYVQVTGKAKRILAGEYRLSGGHSLFKVVGELTRGPVEIWVTIPEGLRREEVVERFIKGLEKKETETPAFRKEFLEVSDGQEGFLFPDTYLFPKDSVASAVVNKMRSTFDIKTAQLNEGIKASELTLREIVILASIIERETRTEDERPTVAGVLINRLNIGMGLQADAAVQYAVAESSNWWPVLTRDDLATNSPFNTYRFRGLPPAPIANPGLSSLRAVIFPEETDYLYYLHDSNGQAHYAETLAEHNENIRKYLGK